MHCPNCHSIHLIKNGIIHNGKPKSKCKDYGHQFVANPTHRRISDATKQLIDKLLLERISLAGIDVSPAFHFAGCNTTSMASMLLFPAL